MPAAAATSVTGTGHETRRSAASSLAPGEGDVVGVALASGLEDGDALPEGEGLEDGDALPEGE
ncbi:MAG: hypothetical protein ACOYO9_13315, partial [Candidatus Nanopelagicales bacterium]